MTNQQRRLRAHLKRIARSSGLARQGIITPYAGSFLDFLDAVGKGGLSRSAWRTFWKVVGSTVKPPKGLKTVGR